MSRRGEPRSPEELAEIRRKRAEGGKKGGRPRKEIDWDRVAYLANMGATAMEIAAVMGVSEDTLRSGRNGKVFRGILEGGVLKANVSIRRVLFGTLRGRLVDPATGEVEVVPVEERIAMAKYLANRKTYLNLEESASSADVTSGGKPLGDGVRVLTVTVKGEPDEDE